MFEIVFVLALAICTVAGAICVWALLCNDKTYRQRQQRLNRIKPGDPDFSEKIKQFDRVTYNKHMKTLMLFGNPNDLYEQ